MSSDAGASATLGLAIALGLFTLVFAAALQMTKSTAEGAASVTPARLEPALESLVLRLVDPLRPGEISRARLDALVDAAASGTTSWLPLVGLEGATTPVVRARVEPAVVAYENGMVGALKDYRVAYLGRSGSSTEGPEIDTVSQVGASLDPDHIFYDQLDEDRLPLTLAGFDPSGGADWSVVDARKAYSFGSSAPACLKVPDPRGGSLVAGAPAIETIPALLVTSSHIEGYSVAGACPTTRHWSYSSGDASLPVATVAIPPKESRSSVHIHVKSYLAVPANYEDKDYGRVEICVTTRKTDECGTADWHMPQGSQSYEFRSNLWTTGACAAVVDKFCPVDLTLPSSYAGFLHVRLRFISTFSGSTEANIGWFVESVRITAEKSGAPALGPSCGPSILRVELYCNVLDGKVAAFDVLVVGSLVFDSLWLEKAGPILERRVENGMGLIVLGGSRDSANDAFWAKFGIKWTPHPDESTRRPRLKDLLFERPLDEPLLSTPHSLKYWYALTPEMLDTTTPGPVVPTPPGYPKYVSLAKVRFGYEHVTPGGGGGGGGGGGTGCGMQQLSIPHEEHRVNTLCLTGHEPAVFTPASFLGLVEHAPGSKAGCVVVTAGYPSQFNFYNDGALDFFANAFVSCRFSALTHTFTTYPDGTAPDGAPLSHAESLLLAGREHGAGRIRVSLDSW